jgi:hypothetical protein
MIAAANKLLGLVDGNTIIVPGHGEPANQGDLREYHDRLGAIRTRIRDAIRGGLTEDQVVALHPTAAIAKQGRGADRWVRVVYREYH